MGYKELADRLEKRYKANETGSTFVTLCSRQDVLNAATAITDLLARAEAAEARAEKAERERDAALQQLEIKLKEQMFANYINPYPPMMPQKEK
jgi:hypothetical protein